MKNKGRKHLSKSMNCKGYLSHLTRPITSMSKGNAGGFGPSGSNRSAKFDKRKWSKRVRGYFKSQTKDVLWQGEE